MGFPQVRSPSLPHINSRTWHNLCMSNGVIIILRGGLVTSEIIKAAFVDWIIHRDIGGIISGGVHQPSQMMKECS